MRRRSRAPKAGWSWAWSDWASASCSTLEGELFLVIHLMIAGRFRWKAAGAAVPGKVGLLALDFEHGTLILTEAGSKRRASLHVVQPDATRCGH